MSVGAILLAGGTGKRLGLDLEKPLVPLVGRPLFAWSLEALERCNAVQGIVVVGPPGKLHEMLSTCGFAAVKVVAWVDGGRERRDSVANGLKALPPEYDVIAVHDCARVLVTPTLIARVVADAVANGASIAAIPLEDTLKRGTIHRIDATVPRTGLWRAQTPQVFRRDWLEQAHTIPRSGATDDAMMVEACGHQVRITEGDSLNFKVTTPHDLALAGAWLTARAG
jgi:2-C-methyl-D-erythritol 4-phosphate cytidylyltransferase